MNKIASTIKTAMKINEQITMLHHAPSRSEIFVIGTNHHQDSSSVKEVKQFMNIVDPTCILAEMCVERMMLAELPCNPSIPSVYIPSSLKQENILQYSSYNIVRSFIQRITPTRVMEIENECSIHPEDEYTHGNEIIASYYESCSRHIPFIPIDRNASHTISMLLTKESLLESMYCFWNRIKTGVPMHQILMDSYSRGNYPFLYKSIISSRDEFMASYIKKYCDSHSHQRIVLVVGKGHLEGIENYWNDLMLQKR